MNLTHDAVIFAIDSPLAQWPPILEQMRRRHALELELIAEWMTRTLKFLLEFTYEKITRSPKRNDLNKFYVLMNYS